MKLKSKILIILSIIFILIDNVCFADEVEITEVKFSIFDIYSNNTLPGYSSGDEYSFNVDNNLLEQIRNNENINQYGFIITSEYTDQIRVYFLSQYPYLYNFDTMCDFYGCCFLFSTSDNLLSGSISYMNTHYQIYCRKILYSNTIIYTDNTFETVAYDYSENKNIFLEESNEEPVIEPIEEPSENNTITEISITDEQFSKVNEKLSNIFDTIEFISSAVLGYCIYSFLHNLLERRKV